MIPIIPIVSVLGELLAADSPEEGQQSKHQDDSDEYEDEYHDYRLHQEDQNCNSVDHKVDRVVYDDHEPRTHPHRLAR